MTELREIIKDKSFNGRYAKFYEQLEAAFNEEYSEQDIYVMRCQLVDLGLYKENIIESFDKMRVVYEFAMLP